MRATIPAIFFLFLAACGEQEKVNDHFSLQDSAGVWIAANGTHPDSLQEVWSTPVEPLLQIGSLAGEEVYQFDQIEGAVLTDNGHLVVANGNPLELRVFDSQGKFLKKLGRAGEGPGEFEVMGQLFAGSGDTVYVTGSRVVPIVYRFTISGGFLDATTVKRTDMAAALPDSMLMVEGEGGIFPDRSIVVSARKEGFIDFAKTPSGEPFRPWATAMWLSSDLKSSRVITDIRRLEQMFIAGSDGGRSVAMPLGARSQVTAMGTRNPSRFCASSNESPELHCIDSDGQHRILRWQQNASIISDSAIAAYKALVWKTAKERGTGTAEAQRKIDATIIHKEWEPMQRVLVLADKGVMVASADLNSNGQDPPTRWRVFDPSGQLIGVAKLPPQFHPVHVQQDRIVGLSMTREGVPGVVVYQLSRKR